MEIDISYRQLAVFDTRMQNPFNDWSADHVAQGFAWRPGSVSFGTFEDGALEVEVNRKPFDPDSKAERVIAVPFSVPEAELEVASIASSFAIALPAGEYELVFEHGRNEKGMWAVLHFVPVDAPTSARIIRADDELKNPPSPLVMTATSA
jgi:hypothetical protein